MREFDSGLIHDAAELRKLIMERPDLPIVVLAGEEAAGPDYYWTYCENVSVSINHILDIKTPYDGDCVFCDKDTFKDTVSDALYNEETKQLSVEEYDAMVAAEVAKYEPHWREVIAIYATN